LEGKDKITPDNIIIYILVDDMNAMLAEVVKLGAKKVKEKTEIPNVGWFGLFITWMATQ
jgi:predicted enzyme related to lactoylglutathione lyase